VALAAAAVGLVAGVVGAFASPEHLMRAYLWGWLVRRPAEAAGMTLPLLTVLFIPVALGLRHLYPWARPEDVAAHAVLRHRQPVFSPWFVLLRSFVYLVVWSAWAWRLRALSVEHDRTGDDRLLVRLRRLSAVGFLVYFATMSLAAMDWIASRETDWYSSTFGLAVITGQGATGVALLILLLALLSDAPPLRGVTTADRVHDLGNLLLTVVVLWAYVTFAEYLVVWMGNTQEDVTWYDHRTSGAWRWVGVAIIALHFALPFAFLLFQKAKRNLPALAGVAGAVLLMRAVDLVWMVEPSSPTPEPGRVTWADFVVPLLPAGLWLAAWAWLVARAPLIPLGYRVPAAAPTETAQAGEGGGRGAAGPVA
jgi:hypothetical protein